jgi:hypothetical protein
VRRDPVMAARVVAAIAAEVEHARAFAEETREQVRLELGRLLGKPLPRPLVDEAAHWVDFTTDPLPDAIATLAHDASVLGLAPQTSVTALFG